MPRAGRRGTVPWRQNWDSPRRFSDRLLMPAGRWHHGQQSLNRRCGEGRVVDVAVELDQFDRAMRLASFPPERLPGRRIVERLARPIDRRHAASGKTMLAGPRDAATLRPISAPNCRFSAGVVRISVTLALCR